MYLQSTSRQVDCYFQKAWTDQHEPKCFQSKIVRLIICTFCRSVRTNVGLSWLYLPLRQVDCYLLQNLDQSKRKKMCSKDNGLADNKHDAAFNLIPGIKTVTAKQYARCDITPRKKSWRTVCTCGRKFYTYGRVTHSVRPTQSYLFTLPAQQKAYCPYWTGP